MPHCADLTDCTMILTSKNRVKYDRQKRGKLCIVNVSRICSFSLTSLTTRRGAVWCSEDTRQFVEATKKSFFTWKEADQKSDIRVYTRNPWKFLPWYFPCESLEISSLVFSLCNVHVCMSMTTKKRRHEEIERKMVAHNCQLGICVFHP